MRKRFIGMLTTVAIAAIAACANSAFAQAAIKRKLPPVDELLTLPVPPPDCRDILRKSAAPAADAPIDELIIYWTGTRVSGGAGSFSAGDPDWKPPVMEPAVVKRLLEATGEHPRLIFALIPYMTKENVAQVKLIYSKMIAHDWKDFRESFPDDWGEYLKDWLIEIGGLNDELLKQATELTIDQDNFDVTNALEQLARADWPKAKPLAEKLVTSAQPHAIVAGLSLLCRYDGPSADVIKKLKAIGDDKSAAGDVRNAAISALTERQWDGRDAWYLSLYSDEKILANNDPLGTTVLRSPDYWIPRIAKLVGGQNKAAHNNAVGQLLRFVMSRARADALAPLLPWLSDEHWSTEKNRETFIESLDRIDLPQCVTGLRAVLKNEYADTRAKAARILAHYKVKDAGADLRDAFAKEKSTKFERPIAEAMAVLGAISDDEAAEAIEAYARVSIDPMEDYRYRDRDVTEPADKKKSLGLFSHEEMVHHPAVAEKLTKRIDALAKEPEVAARLIELLKLSKAAEVDAYLIARLEKSLDIDTILAAIERQESMRKNPALAALAAKGGAPGGIAAGIAGGESASKILAGTDNAAIRAMCGAARMGRIPLSVEAIGKLLQSNDAAIATAAELYLIALDTPASRALVLARHPGQALILGPKYGYVVDPVSEDDVYDIAEKEIRKTITAKDGPDEIIAMISSGPWGGVGDLIIEIKGKDITVRHEIGNGKTRLRKATEQELAALKAVLQKYNCDELPPLFNPNVLDGVQFEYLRLTKAGGRRVFMSNPGRSSSSGSVYDMLSTSLERWTRSDDFKIHYAFEKVLPGMKVLYTGGRYDTFAVWRKGDDIRALTHNLEFADGERDEWQKVAGGKLTDHVAEPADFPISKCFPKGKRDFGPNHPTWVASIGDTHVLAGKGTFEGLWLTSAGKELEKINMPKGDYFGPIICAGGKWVIAQRENDDDWKKPRSLVRVEVKTGKMFYFDVPKNQSAYTLFRAGDKVLVELYEAETPEHPARNEYVLADPETGKISPAKGEFWPLHQQRARPLQPTGKPHEVWATLTEPEASTLGRYNTEHFTFTPVMKIPGVSFQTHQIWVEESAGIVTISVNGDIIELPLRSNVAEIKP